MYSIFQSFFTLGILHNTYHYENEHGMILHLNGRKHWICDTVGKSIHSCLTGSNSSIARTAGLMIPTYGAYTRFGWRRPTDTEGSFDSRQPTWLCAAQKTVIILKLVAMKTRDLTNVNLTNKQVLT